MTDLSDGFEPYFKLQIPGHASQMLLLTLKNKGRSLSEWKNLRKSLR